MNGNTIIARAKTHLGESGSPTWEAYKKAKGQSWCCQFVWRVFNECSASKLFYGGSKTAYCPSARQWCKSHLTKVSVANAKAGDIIFFDWNRNGLPDHIGLVNYVKGGVVHTIEGNTGSPARVRARERSSYIQDIWRPKYTEDKPIPKPTGKYTGTIPSGLLKRGSKGEKVKQLQKFLNWYYKFNLAVDGDFGDATEYAVMRFQRAEGITVDGDYGKGSYAKAKAYKTTPPTPQKPSSPSEQTPSRYTGEFPNFTLLSGNIIAKTAKDLAYPLGTKSSKYKYPKGSPTKAFYSALCKVYPSHGSWKPVSTRKGASCDVGAGTVLRYSGAFPSISRALENQFPQMEKSAKFKDVGIKKSSQMRAGDIGMYMNKGRGSHIWVALGGKLIAESNFTAKYYFHLVKKNINKTSHHKKYYCFRMVKPIRNYMKYGDEGSEILKWQKFLKWYGYDIKCDGVFGDSTLTFSRKFQKAQGLAGSGDVGTKTLQKAKAVKK